jgi:CDP-6-deoxy-D-xylo-4-hexulose-3-dehydrase
MHTLFIWSITMSIKYPLATATWDSLEYQAMQDVITSGRFTMGPLVEQCEKDFSRYIGSRFSLMVNSGSSANLLMVAALFYSKNEMLALKPGDEVIVPAVSWSTTYYPLYQYGLKLKFVDIDLYTLNYDLDALRSSISDRTRMIMAVNLLGNPNDFDQIDALVKKHQLILIEDNCESLGAQFKAKKAGTFGVMGSFSSFFSHHISTMEGGFIATDDEEIYHILLSLRAHGWTRNLPKENHVCGLKSDDAFSESFRFVLPGFNVRPLEMSGAIGIEQIKKLPSLIDARRHNGKLLQAKLAHHPDLIIQKEIGESSWFGFSLVIKPGSKLTREALIKKLDQSGFEVRPIVAGNFTKNEVVRYFDYEVFGSLPNANHIDQCGLFVGNHHYPIDDAIDALARL